MIKANKEMRTIKADESQKTEPRKRDKFQMDFQMGEEKTGQN